MPAATGSIVLRPALTRSSAARASATGGLDSFGSRRSGFFTRAR
jgi:hypothetical protein